MASSRYRRTKAIDEADPFAPHRADGAKSLISLRKNLSRIALRKERGRGVLFRAQVGAEPTIARQNCCPEGRVIASMAELTPWVAAFLERRSDLMRYFAARVGEVQAEDLVQETYLRVVTLPADSDIRSPNAYLYRLGHNIMLDRMRQDRRRADRDAE